MSPVLTRARVLAALALTALLVLVGGPAQAHPFGPPQQVAVDADGDPGTVRVRWRVGGTDDLTLLAVSLGVLPQDRVLLDGAVLYEDADAVALARAPELRAYLLDHIAVEGDGVRCRGEVTTADDLATDGVELAFACPAEVSSAAVRVTTLTDLHPAYRTLATGPHGQRAVYGADAPTHDWSLGDSAARRGSAGTSAAVQLGSVLGGLLAAGVAGLGWRRRRARPQLPHAPPTDPSQAPHEGDTVR